MYLISDGVYPSNSGRGYIVRRLIRRVVRMGRLLGIRGDGRGDQQGAFLPTITEVAVAMSGNVDPNVQQQRNKIYNELKREELRFVQTLEKGEKLLEELLTEALEKPDRPCLSGTDVFRLYDTFGFPVEITEEVACERGVAVDLAGFETEMEAQRKQSQAAHSVIKLSSRRGCSRIPETEFLGYDKLLSSSSVLAILANGASLGEASAGEEVEIVLDRTPFYAESGGQIGDHGYLRVFGGDSEAVVKVRDVVKEAGRFRHIGVVEDGRLMVGMGVDAQVDSTLRQRSQVNIYRDLNSRVCLHQSCCSMLISILQQL